MNSVTEFKCGLGFTKTIFWGKGFGKTSANFPPAERGLGNECGRVLGFCFGGMEKTKQILEFHLLKKGIRMKLEVPFSLAPLQ